MSTVQICLKDILGEAVACEVIFYPGDTPFVSGSALAVSGARSIRLDAEGNGSVALLPGRYIVRFTGITGNTDTLLILVPDDAQNHPLSDLICGGNWVLPMRDCLTKSRNLGDIADPAAAFNAIKQAATVSASGAIQLATQAQAEAGTDNTKAMTPLRTLQAINYYFMIAPTIASAASATFYTGNAGNYQITALNNPTSYGATGLPAGLSVDSTTGLISGTPTGSGTSNVTISASNEKGTATATLTIQVLGQTSLLGDLIAYWTLDETSGPRADSTGNGNTLSDGGVAGGPGKNNGGALFDGTAALSGNSFALGDFSFSVWVAPSSGLGWASEMGQFFGTVYQGATWLNLYNWGTGNHAGLEICDPDYARAESVSEIPVNNWTHIVGTRSGNTISLYINGALESTAPCDGNPISISYFVMGGAAAFFNGSVDEAGIWNRALTSDEVALLYNAGNGKPFSDF